MPPLMRSSCLGEREQAPEPPMDARSIGGRPDMESVVASAGQIAASLFSGAK